MTKTCVRCKATKEESEFHKNKKTCAACCNASVARWRAKKLKDGYCIKCCKNFPTGDNSHCEDCLKYKRDRREARKANSRCPDCSEATGDGNRLCGKCRSRKTELEKQRRHALVASGKCYRCRAETVPMNSRCERCVFRDLAWDHLGAKSDWLTLKSIWDSQDGICPYTGIRMTLSESDLDHVIPRCDGGTNDPGNLQFVLSAVNRMKWDNSERDFLLLVRMIADHCKSTGKLESLADATASDILRASSRVRPNTRGRAKCA